MTRRRHLLSLAVLAVCAAPRPAAAQAADYSLESMVRADSAATAWLGQLAALDWKGSYATAAPNFRSRVRLWDWELMVDHLRDQLRRPEKREVIGREYLRDIPPFPPDEYIRIRYVTHLHEGRRVFENVLLGLQPDGEWRIVDYILWPNPQGDIVLPGVPLTSGAGGRASDLRPGGGGPGTVARPSAPTTPSTPSSPKPSRP